MYILYGGPFTRALITEMVLAEGDIAHEVRAVDILNDEHRSPEFLKSNPYSTYQSSYNNNYQTVPYNGVQGQTAGTTWPTSMNSNSGGSSGGLAGGLPGGLSSGAGGFVGHATNFLNQAKQALGI